MHVFAYVRTVCIPFLMYVCTYKHTHIQKCMCVYCICILHTHQCPWHTSTLCSQVLMFLLSPCRRVMNTTASDVVAASTEWFSKSVRACRKGRKQHCRLAHNSKPSSCLHNTKLMTNTLYCHVLPPTALVKHAHTAPRQPAPALCPPW